MINQLIDELFQLYRSHTCTYLCLLPCLLLTHYYVSYIRLISTLPPPTAYSLLFIRQTFLFFEENRQYLSFYCFCFFPWLLLYLFQLTMSPITLCFTSSVSHHECWQSARYKQNRADVHQNIASWPWGSHCQLKPTSSWCSCDVKINVFFPRQHSLLVIRPTINLLF